MPMGVALGPIYTALRTLMVMHAPLATVLAPDVRDPMVAAIYTEGGVPQHAVMPYLTMGAGTQVPFHTMGLPTAQKWGWNCTLQIKAVAAADGEDVGFAIMDALMALFYQGLDLPVSGYGSAWIDDWSLQPTIISLVSGVRIREWPGILRVYVHDAA